MPVPKKTPPGFYSYKHLEGADRVYLNKLRVNLEHDLLTVTGVPIKLWQDVEEIKWGQEWKKAIHKGLGDAAFFLPVITPGYLFSNVCKDEFEKFAAYEKKLGRTDLILPLIYVRPEDFDDEESKKKDPIVRLCLERQYVNWEDLRGLGDEGQEYRIRLTTLSKRIRSLLSTLPSASSAVESTGKKKPTRANRKSSVRKKGNSSAQGGDTSAQAFGGSRKDETAAPMQRTLYVNRLGHPGTFQTIAKALEAAEGGDRILVAPGHYSEALVLTKPVVIVGEGNLGEVAVAVKDAHVVHSTAPFGRLQNLSLRQHGGDMKFGVRVAAGSLEIDGCEVTSASIACVGVQDGAEVRIRRSRVHGSPKSGVCFFQGSKGVVEESDIYENGLSGVALQGSGDVTIRGNKIHHGRGSAIRISAEARGLIEDNEIFANTLAGISILDRADPTVRRNRIYDGKEGGVHVSQNAKGTIVENDIFGNTLSGVLIFEGGTPSISKNYIHDNQGGLFFYTDGGGVIESNRVERNTWNGAAIQEGAKPQLRNNIFVENKNFGIRVAADGGGVFEGNEFEGNKSGEKLIDPAAEPNVQWKD